MFRKTFCFYVLWLRKSKQYFFCTFIEHIKEFLVDGFDFVQDKSCLCDLRLQLASGMLQPRVNPC
jgi:hypothetical protein